MKGTKLSSRENTASRWLEVAVNGPWTRKHQLLIPITEQEIIEEGIACVEEGASIVHVHAYDPSTGQQKDDPDIYARIIEGIRTKVDAIVCPTVPFAAHSAGPGAVGNADRFGAIDVLGGRGLLECSVMDLGSLNFVTYDELAEGKNGFVHTNSVQEIRHNASLAIAHGFHPSYTIYEPGFLRFGAALRRLHPSMPTPIYRLMFTDVYTFGLRPDGRALDTYLDLLRELDPEMPWMVAGLGVDVAPIFERALNAGGHIRVGLEDLPANADQTNLALVKSAVAQMRSAGFEPASASMIREALRR